MSTRPGSIVTGIATGSGVSGQPSCAARAAEPTHTMVSPRTTTTPSSITSVGVTTLPRKYSGEVGSLMLGYRPSGDVGGSVWPPDSTEKGSSSSVVDIVWHWPGSSRTADRPTLLASTQTIAVHASSSMSTVARAPSLHGFQTTVVSEPSLPIRIERPAPSSRSVTLALV